MMVRPYTSFFAEFMNDPPPHEVSIPSAQVSRSPFDSKTDLIKEMVGAGPEAPQDHRAGKSLRGKVNTSSRPHIAQLTNQR